MRSAWPCTVRGSPSQRTGCWTVWTAATADHGRVVVRSRFTWRRPRALTQTPTRTRRSASVITSMATAAQIAAPTGDPASAMISAESRTNEASSSNTAAAPTRHGPGR